MKQESKVPSFLFWIPHAAECPQRQRHEETSEQAFSGTADFLSFVACPQRRQHDEADKQDSVGLRRSIHLLSGTTQQVREATLQRLILISVVAFVIFKSSFQYYKEIAGIHI